MNEQQPEFTLDELLKVKPQSPADLAYFGAFRPLISGLYDR